MNPDECDDLESMAELRESVDRLKFENRRLRGGLSHISLEHRKVLHTSAGDAALAYVASITIKMVDEILNPEK